MSEESERREKVGRIKNECRKRMKVERKTMKEMSSSLLKWLILKREKR